MLVTSEATQTHLLTVNASGPLCVGRLLRSEQGRCQDQSTNHQTLFVYRASTLRRQVRLFSDIVPAPSAIYLSSISYIFESLSVSSAKPCSFVLLCVCVISVRSLEHSDYMKTAGVVQDGHLCASCRHANPVMAFQLATQKFQLR
jgi:hypothetical protein